MKDRKIAIIGSGAMGTAISKVLFDAGYKHLTIYGIDQDEVNDLKKGINTKYFHNSIKLPNFNATTDIKEALKDANYVVMAVPSVKMDIALEEVKKWITTSSLIINVSKGFYPNTKESLHKGILEVTKDMKIIRGVVSLIGPSHAEEIVKKAPTIVSVVSKDKLLCEEVQLIFKNDYFKTYIQTDVNGAETGAAYKNILAIASGLAAGMGYGINTQAGILTRGIAEMEIFNKVAKGKKKTLMGLTGIGDIIVTALSDLSRNYTFGKEFAKHGKKALDTNVTIEGLASLNTIYEIGRQKKLRLPIVYSLYSILYEGEPKKSVISKMWNAPLKSE